MARRSSNNLWIGAAVLLGGAYWLMSRKASAATPDATLPLPGVAIQPPSLNPGSSATTASQASVTSAIWQNLTPTTGPSSGYVNFPSGSQAAAALLPWATDGQGNYYTQWSAQIYYISGVPDQYGNYPATLLGA